MGEKGCGVGLFEINSTGGFEFKIDIRRFTTP
jgi:hypothetical protein